MTDTAMVQRTPLVKQAALEYLERRNEPATAKELAIDLDSRASTASELLERMTAQGLVKRDEKQRPREYVLTEAGRKRLEFFRSAQAAASVPDSTGGKSNPGPDADPNPNPDPDSTGESESESRRLNALKEEVSLQFQSLREDMRDLFEALGVQRPRGGESSDLRGRIEALRKRAEALDEEVEDELDPEAIPNLYRARYELESLSFWSLKEPVQERIAGWEGVLGKETAEQVERLVELEREIDQADRLRSVLALRQTLPLPVEVFGPAPGS